MQKNVASQKWTVFAFDLTDNTPKTGDAANITADVFIDGVVNAVDDTNPTELAHGYYEFDMAQAETNGDYLTMDPVSATGNIQVIGVPGALWTTAPNANLFSIDGNGRIDVGEWLGTAVPAPNVAGRPVVSGGYEGGAVWINTLISNTNTVDHVDGTIENPVSTIAAATTIAASLGIKKFNLMPGSSITLAQAYDNYIFDACHATISLGGQSVNNSVFIGCLISGSDDGSNANHTQYFDCVFTSSTLGQFVFTRCYITGTITLAQTGTYFMHQSFSGLAGLSTPVLDFGAALAVSEVSMRDFSGGVHIHNMGNTGADLLTVEGRGQIIINANCNPANSPVIAIRGNISPLTDNVAGGFISGGGTISQDARYDTGQILSAITDDDTPIDASQLNTHTAITPATVGAAMNLAADAIKAESYDESTAFPVKSVDSGATQIARVGADSDTLETLSDQIDAVPTVVENRQEMDSNSTELGKIGTIPALDGAGQTIGAAIAKLADDNAGADFDATTDSQQALRDRGDAAWITGGGGGITDILNVQALIPNDIDLANTATVRIGLGLTNMLDDLPTTVEITPGTITIDRKAIGGTSWTNVVNAAACSEAAGLIYYDEVFDTGTAYAEGDSIRITFKNQKIVVAANDYEITGSDGWIFQTSIRQTMVGTNNANTTTPPTAVQNRQEIDSNSTQLAAIKAKADLLPEGPQKNVALDDLEFLMVDETDFATPETGLTVTGQVSKDGAAFGNIAGSIAEVSNGIYSCDAAQADMNADILTFRFSAAGAADTFITIKTTA